MNFNEIKDAVKHLQKTCTCAHCKGKYKLSNINIIATTKNEGLFEIICSNCQKSTIVTVVRGKTTEIKNTPFDERSHHGISYNDVLDTKNFLEGFDGNFKKIFTKQK